MKSLKTISKLDVEAFSQKAICLSAIVNAGSINGFKEEK